MELVNYWYRLITQAIKNRDVFNGLTIPYILGAHKLSFPDYILDQNSVQKLLVDILNSQNELTAVLEKCEFINQYVIALRNHQSLEDNFRHEIRFKNEMGVYNLFVINEAKLLGSSIDETSTSLTDMYQKYMFKNEFSWNPNHKLWERFSERDKKTIVQAL